MVSVGAMVQQLAGLLDTEYLSDWEDGFIRSMVDKTANGQRTSHLSEQTVEKIEELFRRHFA